MLAGAEPQTHFKHRLRLKVFTERGLDTPETGGDPLRHRYLRPDVPARTVRPDGTIVEVKKAGRPRAHPGQGRRPQGPRSSPSPCRAWCPGAIVDYRWTEHRIKQIANFIAPGPAAGRAGPGGAPPRQAALGLLQELGYAMALRWFRHPATEASRTVKGFTGFTYTDLPAFKEEPLMAPEYLLRRWLLVYYSDSPDQSPQGYFWKKMSRGLYERHQARQACWHLRSRRFRPRAVAGATTPEAKVARLVAACRQQVEAWTWTPPISTPEARKKLKAEQGLRRHAEARHGNGRRRPPVPRPGDPRRDSTRALPPCPTAPSIPSTPSFADDYFLVSRSVAVRDGDGWLFVDPTLSYLPPGMLRWQEEGQVALIADPQQALLVSTPSSPPQQSLAQTRGHAAPLRGRHARGIRARDVHRPPRERAQRGRRRPVGDRARRRRSSRRCSGG